MTAEERVPSYKGQKGWNGWGQPAILTPAQADSMARSVVLDGRCGSRLESPVFGSLVCDQHEDSCAQGSHGDGRHAAHWPLEGAPR